jgi:hypothetical protein
VFLDVDDLRNIDNLEVGTAPNNHPHMFCMVIVVGTRSQVHIAESAVMLVFLSAGYFSSRNCLREIR